MQRVFLTQEAYDDLRQLPQDQRKICRENLEKFLLSQSEKDCGFESVSAGDPNTFSYKVTPDFQVLFRRFPDVENDSQFAWVLVRIATQASLPDLAKGIRFAWDGETASLLQVLTEKGKIRKEKPFSVYSEEELARLGIPKTLFEKTKNIEQNQDLQKIEGDLTPRCFFRLVNLFQQVEDLEEDLQILDDHLSKGELENLEMEIAESLDDLFHSDRFFLIESTDQLSKIVEKDLPAWMFFPLPDQKKWFTRNFKGPVLIRGVAGSGRSSLALLRAQYLAQEILEGSQEKILVTTPLRHMAKFLEEDLRNLGGERNCQIEVQHIYGWATSYLQNQGIKAEVNSTEALELLKEAIDACRPGMPNITPFHLDFNFVRDEIFTIIKGRGLRTQPNYLDLPRRGFGTPLNADERRHLWRIYLKYQDLLKERGIMDSADLLVNTYQHLQKKSGTTSYAAVIVDDVQDLPPLGLQILHHLVRDRANGLFLLSDVAQKHTRSGESLAKLGLRLSMRSPLLRTNMRTTKEISEAALAVMGNTPSDELDGSGSNPMVQPEVNRKGARPQFSFHENEEDEILWILELIMELTGDAYGYQHGDIAVVTRSNRYLTLLEVNLSESQIPAQNFKKAGADRTTNKVKICNYYECKGMDFPVVILTEVIDGQIPLVPAGIDSDELVAHLHRERRLLYWGMNRARDLLYVSGSSGEPSRFLEPLLQSQSSSADEPETASPSETETPSTKETV